MRTIGRAFPISKNQAKGYSYVKAPRKPRRKLRKNPGVTHIAAINGRGAYKRSQSARLATNGLTKAARIRRAKAALSREQNKSRIKSNSARKRTVNNRRKTGMRRNAQTPAQKRASLKNLRKARSARKTTRRASPKRRTSRRKATARKAAPKRRTRRTTSRATPRKRVSAKRSAAAKKAARTRKRRASMAANRGKTVRRNAPKRRRKTARKSPARKTKRSTSAKRSAAMKRVWARRKRACPTPTKRRKTARKGKKRVSAKRSAAAKRGWQTRKSRATFRKKAGLSPNRRRRTTRRKQRRNARMSYVSNRRRTTRRKLRRNSRSRMRRNQGLGGAFRAGAWIAAGLVGHKVITGLVRDLIFKPAVETVAPEAAAEPPTSGLGQLHGYGGALVGLGTAAAGILIANKLIKKEEDRKYVVGGIAASFLHTALVTILDLVGQPKVATMLSGMEDGTAAKISAMYGLGAGTSIQPEYQPIGEYFRGGSMGEYFTGMQGMGEYFNSGVEGLGALKPYEAAAGFGNTYSSNPDLYQAAAGLGNIQEHQGNHIDPSSDLERELTIAEAAAGVGVGNLYQAAAGFGATQAPVRVSTVGRSSTWIPGQSDPSIWAGVRSINEPQSQHEMLPAGILQTDGGQGVFG